MKKIMFVCTGNVCRSPMGMFMLRNRLKQLNLDAEYEVTSAGLLESTKGQDMHPKCRQELEKAGIPFTVHAAHPLRPREFLEMDYILYMEKYQKIEIKRMMNGRHMEKVHRILDYTDCPSDLADPYYTLDFDKAYQDLARGIDAFVNKEILGRK